MPLPIPEFFAADANDIVADMLAYYEFTTGKTIAPADPEMLIINMFAYREVVLRNALNDTASQNLVAFSRYPVLDYLAELVGVVRLPAASAGTTLEFTLVSGHGNVIIPQGTRVSSQDGNIVFETDEQVTCPAGTDIFDVSATAQTPGTIGNGYILDKIITLIDVLAFVATVTNTTVTAGGSDEETDEQLRERIKLAPEAYSNAGSEGAYKFNTYTAHPTIIDVAIVSPIPGTVEVYPLSTAGIPTPQPVLDAVEDVLNDPDQKVRPLTDTVNVIAPTPVSYDIEVDITLYDTADAVTTEQLIQEALDAYSLDKGKKLGRDIMRAQISSLCNIDNNVSVYNVTVVQPPADVIINEMSFGNIGTVTVNIIGFNNG